MSSWSFARRNGPAISPPHRLTADEAKALQGLLKLNAQEVFTGVNATEEKLMGLHGPRILHVAVESGGATRAALLAMRAHRLR